MSALTTEANKIAMAERVPDRLLTAQQNYRS